MGYQNGCLRPVEKKEGRVWMFRYRLNKDGKRVENTKRIGLVRDFPTESAAMREVDRLGLRLEINTPQTAQKKKETFGELAKRYLEKRQGETSGNAHTTRSAVESYTRVHLVPRWGNLAADEIERKDIRDWLDGMKKDYEGPTLSKMKGIMGAIYVFGLFEKAVTQNPAAGWRLEGVQSTHVPVIMNPVQALRVIHELDNPVDRLIVLIAASTALRASEIFGLKWSDLSVDSIFINRGWTAAQEGRTKNEQSRAPVPMSNVLALNLNAWRELTLYPRDTDWIFPSLKEGGEIPMSAGVWVTKHLRPAAIRAGMQIEEGRRFGLHAFRSSLATWIVSIDKSDPKTAQGILRHKNIETTLGLYAKVVTEESHGAQGRYLEALNPGIVVDQIVDQGNSHGSL